jgi:hypothetical protein
MTMKMRSLPHQLQPFKLDAPDKPLAVVVDLDQCAAAAGGKFQN